MSTIRHALLQSRFGLESVEVVEDENVVIADMPMEDPVADSIDEMNNEHDDAVEIENVTDDVTQVAEGLESILVSMESTLASGGMNAQAAQFAQLAITATGGRYGIGANTVPSVESFGGKSAQLQQTRVAIESLKDRIKKVWEYIKEAVEKMIAKIKDFYLRTFDSAARLAKAAAETYKKADQKNGELKDNDKKVTISKSLVEKLSVSGKLDVVSDIAKLKQSTDTVLTTGVKNAVDFGNKFAKALGDIDVTNDAPLTALAALQLPASPLTGSKITTQERFKSLKDKEVSISAELMGGKGLIVETFNGTTETDGDRVNALTQMKYEVGSFAEKPDEAKEVEEAPISLNDIRKVCQEVESLAKEVENFKRKSEEPAKAADALKKAGEKLSKAIGGKDDLSAPVQSQLNRALNAIPAITAATAQPAAKFINYTIPTAKAALEYAEKHLSAYK